MVLVGFRVGLVATANVNYMGLREGCKLSSFNSRLIGMVSLGLETYVREESRYGIV